jgi:hypothetical protein
MAMVPSTLQMVVLATLLVGQPQVVSESSLATSTVTVEQTLLWYVKKVVGPRFQ